MTDRPQPAVYLVSGSGSTTVAIAQIELRNVFTFHAMWKWILSKQPQYIGKPMVIENRFFVETEIVANDQELPIGSTGFHRIFDDASWDDCKIDLLAHNIPDFPGAAHRKPIFSIRVLQPDVDVFDFQNREVVFYSVWKLLNIISSPPPPDEMFQPGGHLLAYLQALGERGQQK